jgi:transcriptional regulator with XRE-family HTH domain
MAKAPSNGMRRFAYLLKWMREHEGWSQRVLADKLETSQSNIDKVENLRGSTVGFALLERAVIAFGIDPAYFFVEGDVVELDPSRYPRQRVAAQRAASAEVGDLQETVATLQQAVKALAAEVRSAKSDRPKRHVSGDYRAARKR